MAYARLDKNEAKYSGRWKPIIFDINMFYSSELISPKDFTYKK
jgi:hypothetical protein